jgi:hypothetical protein
MPCETMGSAACIPQILLKPHIFSPGTPAPQSSFCPQPSPASILRSNTFPYVLEPTVISSITKNTIASHERYSTRRRLRHRIQELVQTAIEGHPSRCALLLLLRAADNFLTPSQRALRKSKSRDLAALTSMPPTRM